MILLPMHICSDQFDWPYIVRTLDEVGAISFPFLTEDLRHTLVEAALHLPFIAQPREVSKGLVLQEIESSTVFSEDSIFKIFAREYEASLCASCRRYGLFPFATPFEINDISIQRYAGGSSGITPHVDGPLHRNMVSLFFLEGQANFCVCANRNGEHAMAVDVTPGHILLMRANGFRTHTNTPFHFVQNITTERYVLGLRQKNKTAK